MNRSVILAISVLTLTAASQPLLAAESETPAPREGAAPAPERATPSARPAQRTQPVQQQRAAQQQQASQSSQSSSFTGSQAGGFGGGNTGGGSFADPVNLCHDGFNETFNGISCTGAPYTYSASRKVQGSGGGFYSYSVPLFGWAIIGVQGEIVGQRVNSSSTQSNTHPDVPFGCCNRVTTETYTSNFNIGTNGSVLFKFGVPVNIPLMLGRAPGIVTKDGVRTSPYNASQTILIYGLVGPTWARIDGSYTYSGTNYCASPVGCGSLTPTTAYGALNWSQTRTGIGAGVGAEWAFMPGVNLKLEYRYTSFGSISQDVPLAVTQVFGTPGCPSTSVANCASTAHINISNLNFQSVRLGVGFGL
jgi:hypothetical protein